MGNGLPERVSQDWDLGSPNVLEIMNKLLLVG